MQKIIAFWKETEKLKLIERIPCLSDRKRRENDAEHSWHLALMIMTVKDEIGINFDELKALKLAIVHDLVEIYTGDSWPETEQEKNKKRQKEIISADKLFSLLPADMQKEYYGLWQEYDEGKTIESKVVKALDKICYTLQVEVSNNKIVWRGTTEDIGSHSRRPYALPYLEFNKELTNIFDHLDQEIENKKK